MTRAGAARTLWAFLGTPLALIVVYVSLLMWPAVLSNTGRNLLVFGYVTAVPLMPLLWRGRRVSLIVFTALLTLAVQVVAFGLVNHWFDGTWAA